MQNPYYGGDFDDDVHMKVVENPYYGGVLQDWVVDIAFKLTLWIWFNKKS